MQLNLWYVGLPVLLISFTIFALIFDRFLFPGPADSILETLPSPPPPRSFTFVFEFVFELRAETPF